MIFAVPVSKTIDGKLYLNVRDEGELWDILDNEDIEEELEDDDVIWDDYSSLYISYEGINPVKRNSHGEFEIDYYEDEDDEGPSEEGEEFAERGSWYIRECKWDDGCGGCPYFDICALTQTGSWHSWREAIL